MLTFRANLCSKAYHWFIVEAKNKYYLFIGLAAFWTMFFQVSYPKVSPKTKSWARGVKLKASVSFQLLNRVDHVIPLEHRLRLR